jgi:hypothetical protein
MPYIQFSNPVIMQFNLNVNTQSNAAKISMKSLFTNNSLVYYKPNSLSIGGVGTVKNSRHKSYRT